MAHHILGRHHFAVNQIIGDIKQCTDEGLVTGDTLMLDRLAIPSLGQALANKAALGAYRNDDCVLDLLRLDQPQHLGTKILLAVGPTQPATGHLASAQVHPLDPWRTDEYLIGRTWLRHAGNLAWLQLVGDIILEAALGGTLIVVGTQGGLDHLHEATQQLVIVKAGDTIKMTGDTLAARVELSFLRALRWIET